MAKNIEEKLCLVLEGGGVKCSYQNAVLAVLDYAGFEYDAIVGASFGAFNAAMYIDDGIKKLNEFWNKLDASFIFKNDTISKMMDDVYLKKNPLTEERMQELSTLCSDFNEFRKNISNLYYDAIMNEINESRIRKSKIEFGLNTIKLPFYEYKEDDSSLDILTKLMNFFNPTSAVKEMMEKEITVPLEFVKNEIKEGEIAKYVVASSCIPPFLPINIDGTYYIDGGLIDNTPIKIMASRGYKKFLVIKTNNNPLDLNGIPFGDELDITVIGPKEDFGSPAVFSRLNIESMREKGFNDAVSYVDSITQNKFKKKLERRHITKEVLLEMNK